MLCDYKAHSVAREHRSSKVLKWLAAPPYRFVSFVFLWLFSLLNVRANIVQLLLHIILHYINGQINN